MSTITEPRTELIKVDEAGTLVISSLKDALPFNQTIHEKAIAAVQPLLDTIEAEGMSVELDQQLNDMIVRLSTAVEKMEGKRKPGTQMMTQIAKVFTGLENDLKNLKEKAQAFRNQWAKDQAAEAARKQQQILRDQNIAKERIDLKATVEGQIRQLYLDKLYSFKRHYTSRFNEATLSTIDTIELELKNIKLTYPRDKFNEFEVRVTAIYLQRDELASLIFDVKSGLYDELSANFRENMEELQQNLLGQLPSKKTELKAIENANEERRKELEAQAEQRRIEEEQRLQAEADEQRRKDAEAIETKQSVETAGTLFEATAQMAEITPSAGSVRTGYKIVVSAPVGYQRIAAFWFSKWGISTALEKLEKKTLGQMKSDCEKHMNATGEKIESQYLVYEQDFKAVSKRGA